MAQLIAIQNENYHRNKPYRIRPFSQCIVVLVGGIRQKKIPQEKLLRREYNKLIVSLDSPHKPECICYFLNAISSIKHL